MTNELPAAVRTAVVHEWLVVAGGSEQVLKEILTLFPNADLFCLVDKLSDSDRARLGVGRPRTSFLQRIPRVEKFYRWLLPIMPIAVESLDLSAYDLVISNSHAVAKGARAPINALHICHCCSPMRYAWDLREQYLSEAGLNRGLRGWMAARLLDRLKRWDARTSGRVNEFIAISGFIADRIRRSYNRSSTVIYPPVDTDFYTPAAATSRGDSYIAVSRLVSYKRMANIVAAFRELPDRKLVVIGDGPDRELLAKAAGANVQLMGWQPREVIRDHLRRARALVFAAEEDFGIVPLEAQACGTPVIAFGRGGALETVVSTGPACTGLFFDDPSPSGIAEAVRAFEAHEAPSATACRTNAERFSEEIFRTTFKEFVAKAWAVHTDRRSTSDH